MKTAGNLGVTFAVIEAAESVGVNPKTATLADCCMIADALGRRKGIKASGRQIDPNKVLQLLRANL